MSNSGRSPYATNPLTKSPPLATVRREQAQFDPLAARTADPSPQAPLSARGYDASTAAQRSPVYNDAHPPSPPVQENLETQADKFLVNCRVYPVKAADVSSNFDGILALRKSQSWQDVVKLSHQLMNSPESLQSTTEHQKQRLEQLRYEALFRMKMYDELGTEVTRSLSQLQDTTSAVSDRSFERLYSQRLLLQEIAMMTGHGQDAQQGLLMLQEELASLATTTTQTTLDNIDSDDTIRPQPRQLLAEQWLWQVRMSLVNSAVRGRAWRRAQRELRSMLPLLLALPLTCEEDRSDQTAAIVAVLLRLTRLSLQLGDVKAAAEQLERAGRQIGGIPALSADSALQAQLLLTSGTLLVAHEQHEQAVEAFAAAVDAAQLEASNNDNSDVEEQQQGAPPHSRAKAARLVLFDRQPVAAAAASNIAVCLLYIKDNRGAVSRLETLIALNPLVAMSDAVVFNLCTIYDLSFAPDVSLQKKKLLQKVALRFGLVDPILHWRSFRTN